MLKLVLMAALGLTFAEANAQPAADSNAYPNKVIRLIVPWPAGGTTDLVGRVMAQKLGDSLGRNVVVDNRAGASGSVGTENMLQSPADGHTLLVSSMGTHAMNQFFYKLAFDPVADVAPLSMLVNVPAALVAHPSVTFGNVPGLLTDLAAWALLGGDCGRWCGRRCWSVGRCWFRDRGGGCSWRNGCRRLLSRNLLCRGLL